MADSFWHAVRDQRYREQSGEADRQRKLDDEQRRRADKAMRKAMGRDSPKHRPGSPT
jgi:hypothetical protein